MTQTILILLALVIIILLLSRKSREAVVGICAVAVEQTVKKSANKQKILELLSENPSTSSGQEGLSNSDIREALGVARNSVVRYFDELEREGRVEQIGDSGRGVVYHLKR